MKNSLSEIVGIVETLSQMELNGDCLAVEVESDSAESVIIGTQDGYVAAAIRFLEIVLAAEVAVSSRIELDIDEIEGQPYLYTNDVKHAFNELSTVWPICAYVTDTKEQAERLRKHYSRSK